MRLHPLLLTATLMILMPGGVSAQEPASARSASQKPTKSSADEPAPSSAQDTQEATNLNLPVSLDHIRKALEQQPAQPLLKLPDQPTFKIEVQERNRFQELL